MKKSTLYTLALFLLLLTACGKTVSPTDTVSAPITDTSKTNQLPQPVVNSELLLYKDTSGSYYFDSRSYEAVYGKDGQPYNISYDITIIPTPDGLTRFLADNRDIVNNMKIYHMNDNKDSDRLFYMSNPPQPQTVSKIDIAYIYDLSIQKSRVRRITIHYKDAYKEDSEPDLLGRVYTYHLVRFIRFWTIWDDEEPPAEDFLASLPSSYLTPQIIQYVKTHRLPPPKPGLALYWQNAFHTEYIEKYNIDHDSNRKISFLDLESYSVFPEDGKEIDQNSATRPSKCYYERQQAKFPDKVYRRIASSDYQKGLPDINKEKWLEYEHKDYQGTLTSMRYSVTKTIRRINIYDKT